MEELDYDPERFSIVNPVWHVVDRKSIPDGPPLFATGEGSDGRQYVVAFTDIDLAQRFIERMGHPDAVAIPMPKPSNWIDILENLTGQGHEYVAIDPEPGRRLRIYSIPELIEHVRNMLREQSEN